MRILLTGGGTGGHTFPLIAIARCIKNIDASADILFIGPDKDSKNAFANEGISAKRILAPKIRRYLSPLNFLDIFKLPVGLLQAYLYIFWYMPDIVLSKGGYGSVLVVFISWIFRIPIVIHESDYVPGVANRFLSRFAKKIIVSFEDTLKFFPKDKGVVLGNPIRSDFSKGTEDLAREHMSIKTQKPIVFVIGGSQGSEQINNLMLLAAPKLVSRYEVIHQTGKINFEKINSVMALRLKNGDVKKFLHLYPDLNEEQIKNAYTAASIVVSRAGSGAIFEVAAAGKPSIVIPYTPSAGNHQEKNAHAYAKTGAAVVLEGDNLTPNLFLNTINSILVDQNRWKTMSKAALAFAKPNAAQNIAKELISTI